MLTNRELSMTYRRQARGRGTAREQNHPQGRGVTADKNLTSRGSIPDESWKLHLRAGLEPRIRRGARRAGRRRHMYI